MRDEILNIRNKYLGITKDEQIGGSHQLDALAHQINELLKKAPSNYLIPLFILYTIIKDIGGYHIIANNIDPENRLYMSRSEKTIHIMHKSKDSKESRTILSFSPSDRLVEVVYHQAQTPIPGTSQGGFLVRGVDYRDM